MTVPNIHDATGRPAIELVSTTGDNPIVPPLGGAGIVLLNAEWGDGRTAASVVVNDVSDIAGLPFSLTLQQWELLAYDTGRAPLAIVCAVEIQATTYASNSFTVISGGSSVRPQLGGTPKAQDTALTGWTISLATDTMFRFRLLSFTDATGTLAKIVLGLRALSGP